MKIKLAVSALALTAVLSACGLAPDYHRPQVSQILKFKEDPMRNYEAKSVEVVKEGKLNLSSISYTDPAHWAIILNGHQITPENPPQLENLREFSVDANAVHLAFFRPKLKKTVTIDLRPGQICDTATGKCVKDKNKPKEEIGTWKVAEPSNSLPRGEWWRVFRDERLNELVEAAVQGNDNLKAMTARVRQARAAAKVARSYLFPDADNASSFTRRKPTAIGRGLAPGTSLAIENDYKTDFGLTYELDVIGRVRGGWLASRLDAKAAAASLHDVKLALQADVADIYFALRATDRDIDILNRGIGLRQENVGILKQKRDAGDITELDVASSVVDLENTRRQLHVARERREQLEHALAVAIGKAPMDFSFAKESVHTVIPVIPAGLPSALLERRPDVVAAEKVLEASNERIGLARAGFFPSIVLTGTGGFESGVLGNLFEWGSRSWSIGPLITIPLFGGGRAIANLDRAKGAHEEAVYNYRSSVLVAFRDVEDSLSTLKSLKLQANALSLAESASRRAAEIAKLRYEEGDLGYLESITARREALEAERASVEVRRARLSATVRFIRALGGGWDAPIIPSVSAVTEKKNG